MQHDESEEIRTEMARIRGDLTTGIGEVAQQARELTDWRAIVRRHPWWCLGGAAAAGFMLVPAKNRAGAPMPHRPEGQATAGDPVYQATMPGRGSGGMVSSLVGFAAKTAVRLAVGAATAQVEQALATAVRQTPPAEAEHPVEDSSN